MFKSAIRVNKIKTVAQLRGLSLHAERHDEIGQARVREPTPLPALQPALIRAGRQGLLLDQVERSKGRRQVLGVMSLDAARSYHDGP